MLPESKPPQPLLPRWAPARDANDIVVPGLDTTASIEDQIEQLEQLITIKLQNLDENFAETHHLLTTRLLPAIKRYSVASEPIREAARFWISFFQASAQVRMHMDGDMSHTNDRTPTTMTDHDVATDESQGTVETAQSFHTVPDDLSFHPPPTSSTPLLSRTNAKVANATPSESSFAASIESPFTRIDRQLSSLRLQDAVPSVPLSLPRFVPPPKPTSFSFQETSESSVPPVSHILRPPPLDASVSSTTSSSTPFDKPLFFPPPSRNKSATPLRENIFRRNLLLSSAAPPSGSATPRRAAPSPKKRNPWSTQKQWSGIVDLREPPLVEEDSDSDEDALPAGMSPPVTMRFTRPSDVRLSRAPGSLAAMRVSRGLIADTILATPKAQPTTPGRKRPKRDSVDGGFVAPPSTTSASSMSSGGAFGRMVDDDGMGPGAADDGDDEESFWRPAPPNALNTGGFLDDDDDSDDDFASGIPVASFGSGTHETDTVFGERLAGIVHAAPLRMLGSEVLAGTVDPAGTDEVISTVEQSPTPWGGRRPEHEFYIP